MKGNERANLMRMLDDMIDYFRENKSYLARIYGVFTIRTNSFASVDILVMRNSMREMDQTNQSITFDIKGSLQGRIVRFPKSEDGWWLRGRVGHKKCLKDKNFLKINYDLDQNLIDIPELEL